MFFVLLKMLLVTAKCLMRNFFHVTTLSVKIISVEGHYESS